MAPILKIRKLHKSFTLHHQDGAQIPVLEKFNATIENGEAVAISGSSGKGKSSLLKLIYGTYRAGGGSIFVKHKRAWADIAQAEPHDVMDIRHHTIGFVTQFLRCVPRVPAEVVVAEPLRERGEGEAVALQRARELLDHLHIPERLWHLPPSTFSGGEQQRVNIARGFAARFPILLLDEPTASLDKKNRKRVFELITQEREAGTTIIGVFHDAAERRKASDREISLE
jgi:alpha-D-ribose 1-methylphosphonate 5-triphosphate synthase subunit PhnL